MSPLNHPSVTELRALGIACDGISCNVSSVTDLDKLRDHVQQHHGRVDVLVSNAAVNPEAAPLLHISERAIDKILSVNVKSALLLVQRFQSMIPRGGAVLLVSSVTGYEPSSPLAMYAVSKTALLGLCKGLAAEMGPRGVRVNGLCPGIIPTSFSSALTQSDADRARMEGNTAVGRLGTTEEMGAVAAFLCSDDASYVTGENLVAAGGMRSRL